METSSPETVATVGTGTATSPLADDNTSATSLGYGTSEPGRTKHGRKRDRVALACQRCKAKKQKCDGLRPACAACARLGLKCVFIVPLVPAAGEKKLYIKALEQRVAELESQLASLGQRGVGEDHLRLRTTAAAPTAVFAADHHAYHRLTHSGQPLYHSEPVPLVPSGVAVADDDEGDDILIAVRDLSLSASGHYVGAASNITIGRVLSSVVHSQQPLRAPLSSAAAAGSTFSPSMLAGGSKRRQDAGCQNNQLHNAHGHQPCQGPPPDDDDPTPKSLCTTTHMTDMIGVPFLSPQVAQRLMHGWFTHIATRYPVLLTPKVLALHEGRDWLTDIYEKSILHLIYAVSGRWLESSGEMGHFFSDQHYDLAFEAMDTILQYRDSCTLDYLILMAVYCTRAPRDPGAWTYVGAAMRLCIELGLHRKPRRNIPSVEGEMNKRRFWTAYFLDRDISIALGRPPSISDHDIDADLPLDVDEATDDDDIIRQAAALQLQQLNHHHQQQQQHERQQQQPISVSSTVAAAAPSSSTPPSISFFLRNPPTTLGPFIHRLQLKRIESEIQHAVYRVDQPAKVSNAVIDAFLDRLSVWKEAIPYETRNFVSRPGKPYDGPEFYTIHYYRCVRFLLFPRLAPGETIAGSSNSVGAASVSSVDHDQKQQQQQQQQQQQPESQNGVNMHYLRLCSDACAGIARDYRRLHHAFALGFSALSIQSVFLAGLTLIYCAWLAPTGSVGTVLNVDGPLTDCQILLYIITERYPSARKYRDIFERTKTTILSLIARGEHRPQNPVNLNLNNLDFDMNLHLDADMDAIRQRQEHQQQQPQNQHPQQHQEQRRQSNNGISTVTPSATDVHADVDTEGVADTDAADPTYPVEYAASPWAMIGMGADFSHMISQMTGQAVDDPAATFGSIVGGMMPQAEAGGGGDMAGVMWSDRHGGSGTSGSGYGSYSLDFNPMNGIY